jgi:dihydrofolate synthase/folylpolyglutamate synthase
VLAASIDGFGQRISVKGIAGVYPDLYLPLYGAYQSENLALAIAAVESFLGGGTVPISDEILRIAVADATSPGRLQVVSREPLTVIDAAHNPHGADSLSSALKDFFAAPATIGVVGVLGDKDAAGLLSALSKSFDHLIVTKSSSPRALDENDLASIAREFFEADAVSVSPSLAEAYELAKDMLPNDGAIVVTGSVSMAGDLLKMFREDDDLEEQVD